MRYVKMFLLSDRILKKSLMMWLRRFVLKKKRLCVFIEKLWK